MVETGWMERKEQPLYGRFRTLRISPLSLFLNNIPSSFTPSLFLPSFTPSEVGRDSATEDDGGRTSLSPSL